MFTFKKLTRDDLVMVMNWRCSPHVTKYMATDPKPKYDDQVSWYQNLVKNHNLFHWVIHFEEKPIGLINLADIDWRNKRASFGYYIGEKDYWYLGGFVTPYFYNMILFEGSLALINKLTAEVFEDNERVISLHLKHGFRYVGKYIDHIYKNNTFHNVVVLELHKDVWLTKNQYKDCVGEWL